MILQSEATECGLACLAMVANHHGYEADLPALRRRFSISLKGTTMKTILLMALALYVGVRLISFHLLRQREEEAIAASAKEQSSFIESTRAIQTIEIFGHESERERERV